VRQALRATGSMELKYRYALFGGRPSLIRVVNFTNQSQSGDRLMNRNVFALFGAVALMLTATAALTLSRATLSTSGAGSLKCYDKAGFEKAC
jgi:hypothetical protein